MSKTRIEWATDSFNPGIFGCSKKSDGCRFCYAMAMAVRLERMGQANYAGLTTPQGQWTGEIRLLPIGEAIERVKRYPKSRTGRKTVFTTSMADVLHEDIPIDWIGQVVRAMARTPEIIWQFLTKRAERLPELWSWLQAQGFTRWPENVWVMVSVENQEQADLRIPLALQVPAKVIGLSMEPLLGPVDLSPWLVGPPLPLDSRPGNWTDVAKFLRAAEWQTRIGWIIVGGESGKEARPMHPAWAQSLRGQAVKARVPFLFKQWGEWIPEHDCSPSTPVGGLCKVHPDVGKVRLDSDTLGCTTMRRVGKKAAGRFFVGATNVFDAEWFVHSRGGFFGGGKVAGAPQQVYAGFQLGF